MTTLAFEQFMNDCPNVDELYAELETVSNDLETARRVGQNARDILLSVSMPEHIADAVRNAWQEAGVDAAYAVRSSATAEDLPDASFAGQQDTYLNVIGEEALIDAVRRCWVSLFTDRAILYRVQNNFRHQDVQLSVVVQQMVMSDTSGILFTADPLTGHRHTATIDASFGLGEALVSGLVSQDAIVDPSQWGCHSEAQFGWTDIQCRGHHAARLKYPPSEREVREFEQWQRDFNKAFTAGVEFDDLPEAPVRAVVAGLQRKEPKE